MANTLCTGWTTPHCVPLLCLVWLLACSPHAQPGSYSKSDEVIRVSAGSRVQVFPDVWLEIATSNYTIGAPELYLLWHNESAADVGISNQPVWPARSASSAEISNADAIAASCHLSRRFRPIGWNRAVASEESFQSIDIPAHTWRSGYVLADHLINPVRCEIRMTSELTRSTDSKPLDIVINAANMAAPARVADRLTITPSLEDLSIDAYVSAPYLNSPAIRRLNILLRNNGHQGITISVRAGAPTCPAMHWVHSDDMDWLSELTFQEQPREIAGGGWAVFSVHLKGDVGPPQDSAGCMVRIVLIQHGLANGAEASKAVEVPIKVE